MKLGTVSKQLGMLAREEMDYRKASSSYRKSHDSTNATFSVLVNGSPKTGTTWVLKMVSSIPGYRSVGNFKGNLTSYETVVPGDVIHGHHFYTPELAEVLSEKHTKILLTLRDPRDQTVSRMFHVRRDTTHPYHQQFMTLSQDEMLMACIEGRDILPGAAQMIELTHSWIDTDSGAHLVYYEKLIQNPVEAMTEVFKFLKIPAERDLVKIVVDRNRFERLAMGRKFWKPVRSAGEADQNSHVRKGITGDWKNYFKPAHVERFKACFGSQLIEFGYETGLDW